MDKTCATGTRMMKISLRTVACSSTMVVNVSGLGEGKIWAILASALTMDSEGEITMSQA